ncbi:MAG: transferase [Ignavibacteria bacterium GWF2_33_9]|nr:MAG: transferase [Ignavibacteria bacterium GWF2_33_9]
MGKIIIFGTGTLGKLVKFYFEHDSQFQVDAFTLDRAYIQQDSFMGLPLVPFDEIENIYPPDKYKMFVAVGYNNLNSVRRAKYEESKSKGYTCVSYICSKSSFWGDTVIGENCFILENQVLQPYVTIGNNVVIWSGNHFGHDVIIEDHCWLSSHIVFSGGVRIGESSFVGVNVTFKDNIQVGRKCIIGAGAVMLRNARDKEVYITKSTDLYRLDSEAFEQMMDISRH